jgi:hypothetical protein
MNKVFGIGLNKTGTSTLGTMLERLGYSLKENSLELGLYYRLNTNQNKIKEVLEKYDAFEDMPWPLMYKELDNLYPNAKFILTTRENVDKWLRSQIWQSIVHNDTLGKRHVALCNIVYYKSKTPVNNEELWKNKYIEWNESVREYFKDKDNFIELCWENGDGWEKLCNFLDIPIPKDSSMVHRKPSYFNQYERRYNVIKKNYDRYFEEL